MRNKNIGSLSILSINFKWPSLLSYNHKFKVSIHSHMIIIHTIFSAEAETPETPVVQTEPSPRSCRNQVLFFLDVPVCIGLRVNNSCESCAIVMEDDTYPIPAASVNDVQIEPIPKRSKNHCLFLLLIPLIDGSLLRSSQVS